MPDYKLTALDNRQVAIPDELLHPTSLMENREMHDGPLSDTRGAADGAQPVEREANARWAAPTPSPSTADNG